MNHCVPLSAFPKIFQLGNSYIPNLFTGVVEVTEKIDGSQFGFGITPDGEVVCRSKGVRLRFREQNGMFVEAWDEVERMTSMLKERHAQNERVRAYGAYFYGEYLRKNKHNSLHYGRIPKNHIILFGANIGGKFVNKYNELEDIASTLGLETVPIIYNGEFKSDIDGIEQFKKMLDRDSILGGQKIEGVVIKNYNQPCMIGNLVMPSFGKYVRPEFHELNNKNWTENKPTNKWEMFCKSFKTEARWEKAIQHYKESGKLQKAPQDIGPLMKEIQQDIEKEHKEDIKEFLYNQYVDNIKRIAISGFPEFYKEKLLKGAFNVSEDKS